MEEGDTKTCSNCKREIPSGNFTIHAVHCARNIRVCPVCKEPVPAADLSTHHNQLHKLVPCKQCGDGVCGSDLEDHLRDSCALTPGACRHCELELPRRDLPPHESYCGARTQRCSCGELVMIKYQQLHEQSNHGFIKLEDEPGPEPSWTKNQKSKPVSSPANSLNFIPLTGVWEAPSFHDPRSGPSTSNGVIRPITSNVNIGDLEIPSSSNLPSVEPTLKLKKVPVKRSNDKPQINTSVPETSKINKNLSASGPSRVIKKRPAPPPPRAPPRAPAASPMRDAAYWSALSRQQSEERERREQSAYNASVGLPPVLSAAAKLEKLRKMDALAQREFGDPDEYKSRLRGRVWAAPEPAGEALGRALNGAEGGVEAGALQPMSAAEFLDRFTRLQMSEGVAAGEGGASEGGEGGAGGGARADDRFGDIKRNLRELRRGLKEVTAPYNSGSSGNPANPPRPVPRELSPTSGTTPPRPPSPDSPPPPSPPPVPRALYAEADRDGDGNEVAFLPCEFCERLVPADHLVLHETGCRPDLAQYLIQPQVQRAPSPPHIVAQGEAIVARAKASRRGNANIIYVDGNADRIDANAARIDANPARIDANHIQFNVNAAHGNANVVPVNANIPRDDPNAARANPARANANAARANAARANANAARANAARPNAARGNANIIYVDAEHVDDNIIPVDANPVRANANAARANAARANDNIVPVDANDGRANEDMNEPIIPCEFCMHPYPLYQLMDHQEGCLG